MYPTQVVLVLPPLPVLAESEDRVGELVVVRHQCTRVAHCPEILPGIEAERRSAAARACAKSIARCAMGLAGVLDQRRAERTQPFHVRQLTVEVDGKHESRSIREGGRSGVGVEVEVALADVRQYGHAAALRHRLEGRDERHGRDDDLVPHAQTACDEREPERVEAAGDANAPGNSGVGRKRLLEPPYLGAVDERSRFDQSRDVVEQAWRETSVNASELEERNRRLLHGGSVIGPR